jgi:hypothetical protein
MNGNKSTRPTTSLDGRTANFRDGVQVLLEVIVPSKSNRARFIGGDADTRAVSFESSVSGSPAEADKDLRRPGNKPG